MPGQRGVEVSVGIGGIEVLFYAGADGGTSPDAAHCRGSFPGGLLTGQGTRGTQKR